MEVIYPRVAGLDIHKKLIVACRIAPGKGSRVQREVRSFGTTTAAILRMADWLAEEGVTHVAMEATGVYWKPLYNLLESRFELILANAQHIKAVSGRKTDVQDSEWIADLLRHGLIRRSFVPDRPRTDPPPHYVGRCASAGSESDTEDIGRRQRQARQRRQQRPGPIRTREKVRGRRSRKGLSSPTLLPFVEYLRGRWQAGCTNVAQLKRELNAQGYRGSYSLMMQALSPWRGPRPPPEPGRGRRRGRPRVKRVNVRWLCLRPPEQLEPHERGALENVLADDERLAAGYDLLQRFRRLIVRRSVRDLDEWLEDAADSGLRPFASLSHGIWTDYDAVVNGLKLAWSTGPVEGTVTRLKLIKRMGYGRASTRLLRRRLISAA